MVGNIDRPDSSGDRDQQGPSERPAERITENHNIDSNIIRRLIQDSLTPLRVDPVPTQILIRDIVITRDDRGLINIDCEVQFEVRNRRRN